MATEGDLPMDMKEGTRIDDRVVMVCRTVVGDNLMLSIVVRVCFVYGFCLIWNSSPSHVWL